MSKWLRRLLAVALAAMLALGGLSIATAEDWRDTLRQAFGLPAEDENGQQSETQKQTEVGFVVKLRRSFRSR